MIEVLPNSSANVLGVRVSEGQAAVRKGPWGNQGRGLDLDPMRYACAGFAGQ